MKKYLAVLAAVAALFAGQAFGACAGLNILAGGCSQTDGDAASVSGVAGGSALIGVTATQTTNTSAAAATNTSVATPFFQNSTGGTVTGSQSTIQSGSLGLAGSGGAAAGGAQGGFNGVGVGGFGVNVFALPTP